MKIYLDNCCYNRPFDDQSQLRIRLEAEIKLKIQEGIRLGKVQLIWSYILDYENNLNLFDERRKQIGLWRKYAVKDVDENDEIIHIANTLNQKGIRTLDSMHIACAVFSHCTYFLTTDDKILNKSGLVADIKIVDLFSFMKETSL